MGNDWLSRSSEPCPEASWRTRKQQLSQRNPKSLIGSCSPDEYEYRGTGLLNRVISPVRPPQADSGRDDRMPGFRTRVNSNHSPIPSLRHSVANVCCSAGVKRDITSVILLACPGKILAMSLRPAGVIVATT